MTDPNEPTQNFSEGAREPADTQPDAAPTEPIASGAPAAAAVPAPAVADNGTGKHVSVKRSWLYAGAGVGVLAVIGVAFGLGYLAGYDEGGDRGPHHERGERMHGRTGEMGEFGPGMRWRMNPEGMPGRDGQRPDRQNTDRQNPNQQPSESTTTAPVAPETTAPAMPG